MSEIFPAGVDLNEGYVLSVDKPLGWTSTDVVRKIKFMLQRNGYRRLKVGHAGTLDPLATGVLLVCLGRATKRVEELQAQTKEYVADIMLGATTASHDLEHPIDAEYPYEHITREMVETALQEMTGEQLQTPPVYSAKKIDGTRAYEYAREGVDVELRRSLVNIYSIEILEYELPLVKVRVSCSRGTYIRSIARDLGEKLGSGAHLTALCRTRSGDYTVEQSVSMDEVSEAIIDSPKIKSDKGETKSRI
jgi:tRNA pseudouridine55 synthase